MIARSTSIQLLLSITLHLWGGVRIAAQPAFPDTIAFITTEQHNIVVPAVVNGTDTLMLMFHSSFRGVSLTENGFAKSRSMTLDGLGTGLSWGGSNDTPVSLLNTIRFGTSSWDSVMITIDVNSGPGSDGKFGYDLFAGKVVRVDHGGGWFIVQDDLPKDLSQYEALPITVTDHGLLVDASLTLADSTYTDQFMIHTGFGGTCIVGTDLHTRLPPAAVMDTLGVQELKDSFGHVLRNVVTRASRFQLGRAEVPDLPIQLMDERSQFGVNVLGNDLLRRYDLLIDLRHDRLFIRPVGTASQGVFGPDPMPGRAGY